MTRAGSPDRSHLHPFARALLGTLAIGLTLGLAIALSHWLRLQFGLDAGTEQALQAILASVLTVSAFLFLHRRLDGRPYAVLGLPPFPANARTALWGIGVTAVAALVVFGGVAIMGNLRGTVMEGGQLLTFILTTALTILLFEALPEEIALRGYVYHNLSLRLRRWVAALCTTILFLFVPLATGVQHVILRALGQTPPPWQWAPAGEEPISYFAFLFSFGVILIIARVLTDSVWTAIGIHTTFLTLNRLLLGDSGRTGWALDFTGITPDILMPAYLSLTIILLYSFAEWRGHTVAWNSVPAQPQTARPQTGD